MSREVEVDEVVCTLLRDIRNAIEALPDTASRRAMMTPLRRLELDVAKWRAVPPSVDQRGAVIERALELQVDVRAIDGSHRSS